MRLIIDIPKEFEEDYRKDKFEDFFKRVMCDIGSGVLCGSYEIETAEMFLHALNKSTIVFHCREAKGEQHETN